MSFNELRKTPIVAVASLFFTIGIMGSRPLVPLSALELGIGAGEIGVLVAMHSLLPLLFALSFGKWMDSHGTRAALLFGAIVSSIGLLWPAIFFSRTGIYLSQIFTGVGWAVFILAAQKNLGAIKGDGWNRERRVAVFSLYVAIGSLFGPFMGGALAQFVSFESAFLTLAIAIFIAFLIMSYLRNEEEIGAGGRSTAHARNPLGILSYHPYLGRALMISALILMGKDIYVAYFPVFATSIGISVSVVGAIIALHNSGGVIMRFFLLPLVRRFGKNAVIIYSIMLSGLFFAMIPLADNIYTICLVSFVIGLGLGLGQPLSITATIGLSPPDKVGEVLGFRLSWNRLTQVLTPVTFGGIAVLFNLSAVFWMVGALLMLGSLRLRIPEEALLDPQGER